MSAGRQDPPGHALASSHRPTGRVQESPAQDHAGTQPETDFRSPVRGLRRGVRRDEHRIRALRPYVRLRHESPRSAAPHASRRRPEILAELERAVGGGSCGRDLLRPLAGVRGDDDARTDRAIFAGRFPTDDDAANDQAPGSPVGRRGTARRCPRGPPRPPARLIGRCPEIDGTIDRRRIRGKAGSGIGIRRPKQPHEDGKTKSRQRHQPQHPSSQWTTLRRARVSVRAGLGEPRCPGARQRSRLSASG